METAARTPRPPPPRPTRGQRLPRGLALLGAGLQLGLSKPVGPRGGCGETWAQGLGPRRSRARVLAFEDRAPGPLSGRKHPSPKQRERCLIKAALDGGKQPFEKKAFH